MLYNVNQLPNYHLDFPKNEIKSINVIKILPRVMSLVNCHQKSPVNVIIPNLTVEKILL